MRGNNQEETVKIRAGWRMESSVASSCSNQEPGAAPSITARLPSLHLTCLGCEGTKTVLHVLFHPDLPYNHLH